jgi:hypothetical protein
MTAKPRLSGNCFADPSAAGTSVLHEERLCAAGRGVAKLVHIHDIVTLRSSIASQPKCPRRIQQGCPAIRAVRSGNHTKPARARLSWITPCKQRPQQGLRLSIAPPQTEPG